MPEAAPSWTGPVAAARVLGAILRQLRTRHQLRMAAVSPHIRASVSKLSRIETGESTPVPRDVDDLLDIYEADDQARADAQILMAMVKAGPRAAAQPDVAPGWARRLTGFTAAASRVEHWAGVVIPVPLRTGRYMQELIAAAPLQAPQRTQHLQHHARRSQLLARAPARSAAMLDERVLHRPVGDPDVMIEQLRHLQHLIEAGADVRIVPATCRLTVSATAFTRMVYGPVGPGDVVCLESDTSALYLNAPDDISPFQDVLCRVAEHAADSQRSSFLIEAAIHLYQQQPASGTGGCC
ncbi:helix-turn-helix domain-containing protein [Kitasatospora sp. NPDC094028]